VAALSGGDGVGEAGHGCPMASSGLSLVLAMAFEISAAVSHAPLSKKQHRIPSALLGVCVALVREYMVGGAVPCVVDADEE
jgi:hypothetical protein